MEDIRAAEDVPAEDVPAEDWPAEDWDVLIVGAGISGIDAAWRLKERRPGTFFLILEARARIGGTWDLFRYPGIRSDSDMYTLGFPFRPWRGDKAIVEGAEIRDYVEATAREGGILPHIRFGHRVTRASWSSDEARWTVEVEAEGERRRVCARFLYLGSGYYDYAEGYRPRWPGEEDYRGAIVHPQHWPEGLDVAGKRIAVIGSGATAVTLVPALADQGARVTMVQRTPSYVVSRPERDVLARRLGPRLARLKNIALSMFFFRLARRRPERVKTLVRQGLEAALPPGFDIDRHFTPPYDPWDQRLCLVPDGDLFRAISDGHAAIATGEIERFTRGGLRLASGEEIEADIIVTATGLVMRLLGGIAVDVDGVPVDPGERFAWKGMMLSGVPNLILAFGYTNASWTLKCDLTARWFCRLLRRMERTGARIAMPRAPAGLEERPMLDFTSGYVKRAEGRLPKQGAKAPWRVHQNYFKDLAALRLRPVADTDLELSG